MAESFYDRQVGPERSDEYVHLQGDRILTIDIRTAFRFPQSLRRLAHGKALDDIELFDLVDMRAMMDFHHVEITDGVTTKVLKGREKADWESSREAINEFLEQYMAGNPR